MLQEHPISKFRRLNTNALASQRLAVEPLETSVSKSELAYTLKTAAGAMGIGGAAFHVLDVLIGLVREDDLQAGSEPVVAISNEKLAAYVCRSERTVARLIKRLVEINVLAYKDSGNGKRFINQTGEKYGLSLAPACKRIAEIKGMATRFRAELAAKKKTRRECQKHRRGIRDICEELVRLGQHTSADEYMKRVVAISETNQSHADKAQQLEALYFEALNHPTLSIDDELPAQSEPGEVNDIGLVEPTREHSASADSGIEGVSISLLREACSSLRNEMGLEFHTWMDLLAKSDELRLLLGLSDAGWNKAKTTAGRYTAIACLAVVCEKAFRDPLKLQRPAGYFNGMIAKSEIGELRLRQTVWRLAQVH